MAKQKKAAGPMTPDTMLKEFVKKFHRLTHRTPPDKVFRDFAETSAIGLSNPIDKVHYDVREARFIQIFKSYESLDDRLLFHSMFHEMVDIMAFGLDDVFQKIWIATEMRGNSRLGQTFTPYSLSKMIATMALQNAKEVIDQRGFITAQEPACGPGGMIVAMADALSDQGINFQHTLHVTGIDVDPLCVHMSYVQASLYGIPAIIHQGNSLTLEMRDVWITPMHVINHWTDKLRTREFVDAAKALLCPPDSLNVHEAWGRSSTAERLQLMTEAGIEDLSLLLDKNVPDAVRAPLEHQLRETAD